MSAGGRYIRSGHRMGKVSIMRDEAMRFEYTRVFDQRVLAADGRSEMWLLLAAVFSWSEIG